LPASVAYGKRCPRHSSPLLPTKSDQICTVHSPSIQTPLMSVGPSSATPRSPRSRICNGHPHHHNQTESDLCPLGAIDSFWSKFQSSIYFFSFFTIYFKKPLSGYLEKCLLNMFFFFSSSKSISIQLSKFSLNFSSKIYFYDFIYHF
jgi:hypothetical protein